MYKMLSLFFLFSILNSAFTTVAQVAGCKDATATNFNATATKTDGSCIYARSTYIPIVKVPALSVTLAENSGLQWAGEALWTFTDGGGPAAIYKIDTISNTILQIVHLAGAVNIDWEDIAFDGTNFYIGDFGNNSNGARTDLKIYKFPIAAIPDPASYPTVTVPEHMISVITFRYADQPEPVTPSIPNYTSYDCEAMLVTNGSIHLFTKDWINKSSTHYTIPDTLQGDYIAKPIETIPINYLVTGADINTNGTVIVLMGYDNQGLGKHYLDVLTDYSDGFFFNGNKRKIELPNAAVMGQGEGLAFRNKFHGYISNERFVRTVGGITFTVEAKLRSFDLTNFIPAYISQ